MMKKTSLKGSLLLGILLFSMFFGSGNLIFPPYMGFEAGMATPLALIGFSLTAIVFPVLGVIAIAMAGDLMHLSGRVGKKFAMIFTVLVFLALGPGLAIPRNAAVSFEMAVVPFMKHVPLYARILYSLAFFAISWLLSVKPEKLVDWLGRILGPILIGLMLLIVIGCFLNAPGGFAAPSGDYAANQITRGFMDGYNTMDTLAALNFGNIIALNVINKGIKEKKTVVRYTVNAGIVAGILLFVIYAALAFVGALSGGTFANAANGANVLTNIVSYLFGMPGLIMLGVIYVLSCLTTCVGLLCSCSEFFASITKISYKKWVALFAGASFLISIIGLNQILSISVPILTALYPIAMVLVILGLLDKKIAKAREIYPCTIATTAVVSIIYALNSIGIVIPFVTKAVLSIPPLPDLCWMIPALAGALIGWLWSLHTEKAQAPLADQA